PSALAGLEQVPVAGLQVPAAWHWSWAVQATGVPAQTPWVQTSLVVQASPSSQGVLSAIGPQVWSAPQGWQAPVQPPEATCPPQPSATDPQAFAPHLAGRQQVWSPRQTSPAIGQPAGQCAVPPQPSGTSPQSATPASFLQTLSGVQQLPWAQVWPAAQ